MRKLGYMQQLIQAPELIFYNFYQVFINYKLTGNIGQNELNDIIAISEMCPMEGGNVVYIARTLRWILINEFPYYDDECENVESKSFITTESEERLIQVAPNPGTGVFNFMYHVLEDADISIYDYSGRRIFITNLSKDNNNFLLDISGYESGIYFYHVHDGNGNSLDSGKFMLFKN
jgi:hypothetical protein